MASGVPFLFGQLTLFLSGKKKGSMKKLALFLIIFALLLIPAVSAADTKLVIKDTPIKNEITWEETAEFELKIENPLLVSEEVYIVAPITDWTISLSSIRVIIPYGQSRTVQVSLKPPADIVAGKYISCFTFKALKHSVSSNHRCVFVLITEGAPYSEKPQEPTGAPEIVVNEEVIDKFLYSTHIITIKNNGNAVAIDEYTKIFELLESFFVTSSPLSSGIRSITDGKEFYWQYTLQPGDSKEISYTVSFFPLVLSIAIVIISLIFLMSFYTSGLKIEKKLLIPTKIVHGKKSVKVKLSVKNGTNKEIKNVHIEDYIPTPLTLVEHFGTLEPSVVKKLENKVKLVWKLPELAPKEERILSYAFKSKLEVLGKIMLPRARIIYKKDKAKKLTAVYSGILVIKGGKEERLE